LGNPERELREIILQLRTILTAYGETGLDLLWHRPDGSPCGPSAPGAQAENALPPLPNSMDGLRDLVLRCTRCALHQGRKHVVFGEGWPNATLLFVGEGPGEEEDLSGRPFVGEAGRLLSRIIENGMGLERGEVYICNVVKCRPPGNRDPLMEEMETCLPFLRQQIRLVAPRVICTLGRVAGQALLGGDFGINQSRGRWHAYQGIPVMPTFHPAHLLRNPSAKRSVWEDIKKIMNRLGLEVKTND
jgi:uracil-DNA glycosylase family 4